MKTEHAKRVEAEHKKLDGYLAHLARARESKEAKELREALTWHWVKWRGEPKSTAQQRKRRAQYLKLLAAFDEAFR